MFTLEEFMDVRDLKQRGWSVSAIAQQLDIDRKTVRKYLLEPPQPYQRQQPASSKLDPFRNILRERWEQGVRNARKLLDEIRERGYTGGYSLLKMAVAPWREEERERAYVRFETGPGEQSQMDVISATGRAAGFTASPWCWATPVCATWNSRRGRIFITC